ncbi:DEAD-domain-containing protein [Mycena indigotica]|uniref:Anaphase-promoting complex subunit 4 n=1 Tax=Mycena indigotica TaxID=2126181 RepID=A0A8H6SYF8_9AGAR|nr:DEAD-domain-containing protein [Mycena indigotica]KAF7306941.1 DEAD-domain-containing protein [Mycena indigotica]
MSSFSSLATVRLPSVCRLLESACCPDKDLLVLVSRLGGRDRISLWKMNGAKAWEVDVAADNNSSDHVVGLAWSPDGQSIAVVHDPPRVTLHSLQDGHEERTLSIPTSDRVKNVWWFRAEKTVEVKAVPDILKRNGLIPGSSHSILKTLPLLDSLQEDSQKLTATDLFAFQGSHTKSNQKTPLPEVINTWPILDSDPAVASMSSRVKPVDSTNKHLDVPDEANLDSILVVTDDSGRAHFFLDGSYNLGAIHLGANISIPSLSKVPQEPDFIVHVQSAAHDLSSTPLSPRYLKLPMLKQRYVRDMARLSTTSRELVWYCMRVVKEMRVAWFGSENLSGAREIGPQFIRSLENRQTEHFGQQEPTAILDLTYLLLTRRGSESLNDFLGSGDQMSERGIQKWESSMTEALTKLRDYSEKRVAPACQRLHLVLEEALGWSMLAIFIATWLAAIARRELFRFKEFITWLRDAISFTTLTGDFQYQHRHDTLEVNNYLTAGLVVSSIDKWFMGPVPQFNPQDFGVLAGVPDLRSALDRVYTPLDPAAIASQNDLNHLDRNLDALIQEIATRCQRIFDRAAGATSRYASISAQQSQATAARLPQMAIRERMISEDSGFVEYLVSHTRAESSDRTLLCLARLRFDGDTSHKPSVGVVLLDGTLPGEGKAVIVDAQFFDDQLLVVVYRVSDVPFMATVGYSELDYEELDPEGYTTREDVMQRALEMEQGQLAPIPIKEQRRLVHGAGAVSLALNGRVGRRVACLLDGAGTNMEMLDLETDQVEEDEVEE